MTGPPRALFLIVALFTAVAAIACEPFNTFSMLTRDPDGTLVIHPMICSPDNRVYNVALVEGHDGATLWAANAAGDAGVQVPRIRVGDASPEFEETVHFASGTAEGSGRFVTIRLTEFFNGKRRTIDDVADFQSVEVGRYYGGGYYGASEQQFEDLRRELCGTYYGHVDWRWVAGLSAAVAVAAVLTWREFRRGRPRPGMHIPL